MVAVRSSRGKRAFPHSLSPAQLRHWAERFARAGPPELDVSSLLLTPVSPWSLRAGWVITPADLEAAEARLGPNAAAPLILRLHNLTGLGRDPSPPGVYDTVVAGRQGQRYLEFRSAGSVCAAELGLLRPDGGLERLALAEPLALPANGTPCAAPPPRALARWVDRLRQGCAGEETWRVVRLDSAPAAGVSVPALPAPPSPAPALPRVVVTSAALTAGAPGAAGGSGGGAR